MKKKQTSIQKIICLGALGLITLMAACSSNTKTEKKDSATVDSAGMKTLPESAVADTSNAVFNAEEIPLTTKEIGAFPYVMAPEGYKYNDITKNDLRTIHFAVKGHLLPVAGKTYSTNIYKIRESDGPFSMDMVAKEYDQAIKDLGGVQISSKLLPGQIEKIGAKVLDAEGNHAYTVIGVNDYTLNHINTYVIRTAKAQIWIELSLYENGGYIHILQKDNQAS